MKCGLIIVWGRKYCIRVWVKVSNAIVFLHQLVPVIPTIPNGELACMHHFSWELWGSKRSDGCEDGVRLGGICLCREKNNKIGVCVCVCVQFYLSRD